MSAPTAPVAQRFEPTPGKCQPTPEAKTDALTLSAENLRKVCALFYEAFIDDPATNWTIFGAPPKRQAHFRKNVLHQALVKGAALNGGEFYQVDDFKGVSIWMPPGKKIDNPFTIIQAGLPKLVWNSGVKGTKRIFGDYTPQIEQTLKDHLSNRPHWYLFHIAVHPSHQGKGLSRPLFEPHTPGMGQLAPSHDAWAAKQKKRAAGKENGEDPVPVWLEASTPKNRDIYEKYGFQVVHVIRLGKGEVNETGRDEKGAPGVPLFCMKLVQDR